MRLDRFISQTMDLTRSQAQRLLRGGEVAINGIVCRKPATAVASCDQVTLAGAVLALSGPRYFMLNKPAGVVSAREDALHPCALNLLHEPRRDVLHLVGRLDRDTTGLLLVTDDGAWSHRLTSPRRFCPKTYRLELAEPLDASAITVLQQGVSLRGEDRPCRPALLEPLTPTCCRLTLTEGRYHQVKRMLAAVGNRVTALHREQVGAIILDATLAPGEYRPLTAAEIASVS